MTRAPRSRKKKNAATTEPAIAADIAAKPESLALPLPAQDVAAPSPTLDTATTPDAL